jgi:hypothetical protein
MSRKTSTATKVAIAVAIALVITLVLVNNRDTDTAPVSRAVPTEGGIASDAKALVNDTLLGGGSYTGPGTFTTRSAETAYRSEDDATAVAARVSVPGNLKLCLFWYMGGTSPGDGLIIGDQVTRDYSDWGAAVTTGSPADDQVRELKHSPEGIAVRKNVFCTLGNAG